MLLESGALKPGESLKGPIDRKGNMMPEAPAPGSDRAAELARIGAENIRQNQERMARGIEGNVEDAFRMPVGHLRQRIDQLSEHSGEITHRLALDKAGIDESGSPGERLSDAARDALEAQRAEANGAVFKGAIGANQLGRFIFEKCIPLKTEAVQSMKRPGEKETVTTNPMMELSHSDQNMITARVLELGKMARFGAGAEADRFQDKAANFKEPLVDAVKDPAEVAFMLMKLTNALGGPEQVTNQADATNATLELIGLLHERGVIQPRTAEDAAHLAWSMQELRTTLGLENTPEVFANS